MVLSGNLSPEIEKEFRELYYQRHIVYPIVYAGIGVALLVMAVFLLTKTKGTNGMLFGAFLMLAAIFLFVYALAMPRIAWRLSWPVFLDTFGRQLTCEVAQAGIKLKPDTALIPWDVFVGKKQTESLVLLYLDSATAYPIHRSMASNPSDWLELTHLLEKNLHKRVW
jgi:uncharacterized membrane protein